MLSRARKNYLGLQQTNVGDALNVEGRTSETRFPRNTPSSCFVRRFASNML